MYFEEQTEMWLQANVIKLKLTQISSRLVSEGEINCCWNISGFVLIQSAERSQEWWSFSLVWCAACLYSSGGSTPVHYLTSSTTSHFFKCIQWQRNYRNDGSTSELLQALQLQTTDRWRVCVCYEVQSEQLTLQSEAVHKMNKPYFYSTFHNNIRLQSALYGWTRFQIFQEAMGQIESDN